MTDTIAELGNMPSAAAFERLATAVLRASNALYANFSHPGVSAKGKPVKAPFDNVGWEQTFVGGSLVAAAHTTCELSDLRGKWLHDPATVKPRKKGAKPTQPEGDLVKAIDKIKGYRIGEPGLSMKMALTTNREVSADLLVESQTLAAKENIELDVWSASRIANYLDTDPKGQIIREQHLGQPVELISLDLIKKLGLSSIEQHLCIPVDTDYVDRRAINLEGGHVWVVGDSGMGKTSTCAQYLKKQLNTGSPGLVLKHEYIQLSTTIEEAVELELRRQKPHLQALAGRQALALGSTSTPFIILVEDINTSEHPRALLEKLIKWVLIEQRKFDAHSVWRLLCPLWPRHFEIFSQRQDLFALFSTTRMGCFTTVEAAQAVMNRATTLRNPVNYAKAAIIANTLDNDPLLISLFQLNRETDPPLVIKRYVADRFGLIAADAGCSREDVEAAVNVLILEMISRRKTSPRWDDAVTWLVNLPTVRVVDHVLREGSVLRLSGSGNNRQVEGRHDRVMAYLFSCAITDQFSRNCNDEPYMHDPFFAEAVGLAVVEGRVAKNALLCLMKENPLVAFHALKVAVVRRLPYVEIIVGTIIAWLSRRETSTAQMSTRRYMALRMLAQIDSPLVIVLCDAFQPRDAELFVYLAARFRNGDMRAGLSIAHRHTFEARTEHFLELINHVLTQHRSELLNTVNIYLAYSGNNIFEQQHKISALHLAGYIGSDISPKAIQDAWRLEENKSTHREAFLWAAARCCGNEAAATLGPILDYWEKISVVTHVNQRPQEPLTVNRVSANFSIYVPEHALDYFIQRAKCSEALAWPITYLLAMIDHPDSLAFVVRVLAKRNAHAFPDSLRLMLSKKWPLQFKANGKTMSVASKSALYDLVVDRDECENTRLEAFYLWELTACHDDLPKLLTIDSLSVVFDSAMWARARRGDLSVVKMVAEKARQNPCHWLPIGKYVWGEELTAVLVEAIHALRPSPDGADTTDLEFITAEALIHLPDESVEAILNENWNHLNRKAPFIKAALACATPLLSQLVQNAVRETSDPQKLFEFFRANIFVTNELEGGVSLERLRALQPFYHLLADHEISDLWTICTKEGVEDRCVLQLEQMVREHPNRYALLPGDPVDTRVIEAENFMGVGKLYFWFDVQMKRGATRTALLKSVMDIVVDKIDEEKIILVGAIFSEFANREEFEMYRRSCEGIGVKPELIDEVRFNVFSRSLV